MKIQNESNLLDSAINRIDNHIDAALENPDSFLLAKNASGKKIELLTGKDSDQAVTSNFLLPAWN